MRITQIPPPTTDISSLATASALATVDANVDSILATVTANLDAPVSQAGLPVQQAFSHSGWTMVPSTTLAGPKTAAGTTWSDNVYKTLIDVTSSAGVLHFLAIQRAVSVTGTQSIRLTIDGGTPIEFSGSLGTTNECLMAVGTANTAGDIGLQPLRFTASLKVEIKANVSSGSPADNWCNLYCLYTLD